MASLKTVLETWKAKDIIEEDKEFQLTWVESTDTVESVLVLFQKKGITSAPVKGKDEFIGVIDMFDIVTLCCTKFDKSAQLSKDSFRQMEEFASKKVGDILNISGRNEFVAISYDTILLKIIELMSSSSDIHRISVLNEAGDIVGYLSQSRILQFLHKHKIHFTTQFHQKAVSVGTKHPICISMHEFVIAAFTMIEEKRVSAVGVVDDQGKLVSVISASDLKNTHVSPIGELIQDLYQPLQVFLHLKTTGKDKAMEAEAHNVVTVKETDSLEKITSVIEEKKIHRVFVVDTHGKPLHVISIGDILKVFQV